MGGAALLLTGGYVLTALRARRRGEEDDRSEGRAVLFAAVAAGLTISNTAPVLCLLAPLWSVPSRRRPLLRRLGLAALTLMALEVGVALAQQCSTLPSGSNSLAVEQAWLAWPTPYSFWISFSSLFLHLFGVPPCHLTVHKLSWPDMPAYELIYPRMQPSPVQCLAALCWTLGLALWWRSGRGWDPARIVIVSCLISLLGLSLFSSGYDTFEAYMVASHAWPFILLPALLVLNDDDLRRSPVPARWMAAAIGLSALQTVLVFPHIFSLLVRL